MRRTASAGPGRATSTAGPPTPPAPVWRSAWPRSKEAVGGLRSRAAWRPKTPCYGQCSNLATTLSFPTTRMAAHTGWSATSSRNGGCRGRPRTCPTSRRFRQRCSRAPGSSGSKRPPTRCCASPTSRRLRASRTAPLHSWSSTTPSPRRTSSSRLPLGADVVVHSTTKYCGGHSDVIGGALVVADTGIGEELAYHQNALGAIAGPFDAWLVLRGLRTLAVRMDRHCDNAERVAGLLVAHPRVTEVLLPRFAEPPRARGRRQADAPVRWDGVVPRGGWRIRGSRGVQPGSGVHVGLSPSAESSR